MKRHLKVQSVQCEPGKLNTKFPRWTRSLPRWHWSSFLEVGLTAWAVDVVGDGAVAMKLGAGVGSA
jgi:hypothetical protein